MNTEVSNRELQQLPLANVIHWVTVSDAQPDKRGIYFVYDDLGFMGFRNWKDTFWEGDNIVGEPKVTHWTIIEPPCGNNVFGLGEVAEPEAK